MTEVAQTLSAARSNVAGSPSEEDVREVCVCVFIHTFNMHTQLLTYLHHKLDLLSARAIYRCSVSSVSACTQSDKTASIGAATGEIRTPSHSSASSGKQAKPAACHGDAGLAFSSAAVNMAAFGTPRIPLACSRTHVLRTACAAAKVMGSKGSSS
eukprot:1745-Heterococcus_DN1.PRE.2